jgi:hypothetical protein
MRDLFAAFAALAFSIATGTSTAALVVASGGELPLLMLLRLPGRAALVARCVGMILKSGICLAKWRRV